MSDVMRPLGAAGDASRVSIDRLLGGAIRLVQPQDGFRAGLDGLLLAAATDPPRKQGSSIRVLDVGTGAGTAALALAARRQDVAVLGIEKLPQMMGCVRRSIALNHMGGRVAAMGADLATLTPSAVGGPVGALMTNPPYLSRRHVRPSACGARVMAMVEDEVTLPAWLACCARLLRPRGVITLIHRADRVDELMAAMRGHFGHVTVLPLWPRQGMSAKRVLVRARKGTKGPARLAPGLVLHEADGRWTPELQALLGAPCALDWGNGRDA